MNNNTLFKSDLWGFIIVSIAGSALHFIYPISGGSALAGLICPVNESVWEHLKLLFFPCIAYTSWQYFAIGRNFAPFLWGRCCSLVIGMLMIIMLYYTYTGSIGRGYLFVDIGLFFAASALTFALSHFITRSFPAPTKTETLLWLAVVALWGISLFVFTFRPPNIPLFRDPLSGICGIIDTYDIK